ncbi:aminopeptidase M1 [Klebsormidium nitens]|uniref:Aminopeptidase n=1 Tax=Klebsormidium nitens TaxID=105231 RepID=A0A0U9HKL6_KLENI|nr:aminopeptidase M1 [Klebsormidium nitens]|eukprot:GAQ88892.1 aminopeptidase M1 [Klebsormidium nitens]
MAEPPVDVLLPKNVSPVKYTLTLKPDLETFKFGGVAQIELDVKEDTQELKFHAAELEFQKVVVKSDDVSKELGGDAVVLDSEAETATVKLDGATLKKGTALLTIDFTGTLNTNMAGFYRSAYTVGGQKKHLATTQFEATDARRAFPSWDEPAQKAKFDITLVVPSALTALSNMPVVSETDNGDGTKSVHFAETPICSTYLVAFIVGELEKVEGKTKEGVDVRVFTTPGKKEQGRFALEVAAKILSFFNDYFGIDYPLPKSDLVAIPDFAAGAMENWGLITFRETALLVDENTSATGRQRVAYVVAHELAHQWFGNLVTMSWWTDLWLNEGFATWVGWLGVDHVFPEWDVWTQFTGSEATRALTTDALLSSHPVEVPIKDPKEIGQVFDALSYQKGACVIRQLEAALGADDFKKGLHQYLHRHQYGNTVTTDLWAALSESSGKPVQSWMESWTRQTGFPLITVTDNKGLELRQNRFLSSGPPAPEQDQQLWWVPINASQGGGAEGVTELPLFVLKDREADFSSAAPASSDSWLKLNRAQTGIYRVNYTPDLWKALAGAVKSLALPPVDRLGVISDAFALSKAGVLRTSQTLELLLSYANETDYTVWNQLSGDFGELDSILSTTSFYPAVQRVGRQLYSTIGQQIGWDAQPGETHLIGLLRPLVLSKLAKYKDEATIAKSRQLFGLLQGDPTSVHPDLRGVVVSTAVSEGGRAEYEAVKELYRKSDSAEQKIKYLTALGQTKDPELIQDFLNFGIDTEQVRSQDVLYMLGGLSANRYARDAAWEFVKAHWDDVFYPRFKKGMLQYVASIPIRGFASEEKARDAEEFYRTHPVPEAKMEVARSLEAIRSKAQWLARDQEDIDTWLQKNER